jgi:hypothetical protein
MRQRSRRISAARNPVKNSVARFTAFSLIIGGDCAQLLNFFLQMVIGLAQGMLFVQVSMCAGSHRIC